MAEIALTVKTRGTGKRAAKDVRNGGMIPGVFYKNGVEPVSISSDLLSMRPIVYTNEAKTVQLTIEGQDKSYKTFLKDVTFDPVTDKMIHFDLMGLEDDQKVTVTVPLNLVGTSAGVKNGGIMQHVIRKTKITCKAKDMPEFIPIDVSALEIGQSINLHSIKNDKFDFAIKDNAIICIVAKPRVRVAAK